VVAAATTPLIRSTHLPTQRRSGARVLRATGTEVPTYRVQLLHRLERLNQLARHCRYVPRCAIRRNPSIRIAEDCPRRHSKPRPLFYADRNGRPHHRQSFRRPSAFRPTGRGTATES
jgi:hypothetical protein